MARKRLVLPLDGSPVSRQILPVVKRLLDPGDYAITLVRVADEPVGYIGGPPQYVTVDHTVLPVPRSAAAAARGAHPIFQSQTEQTLTSALEDELHSDADELRAAGFEVHTVIRFGDPAEEILAVATAEQCELVAMATHGRSGVQRLVLGSVAEAVLRHTEVPLLLVRATPSADGDM